MGLQEIPQSVTQLKSLTELDLRCNEGIMCLPESLAQLTNLQKLDVSGLWITRDSSKCYSTEIIDRITAYMVKQTYYIFT